MRIGATGAASTVHALCYKLLNLAKKSVIDRQKLQGFSDEIGIPIGTGDVGGEYEGDGYLTAIERAKNRNIRPEQAFEELGRPGTFGSFKAFVTSYDSWKDTFGFVDFSDMLRNVLLRKPDIDFTTLFLDEAQDLSPLQWQVIDYLSGRLKNVFIAGDDDQTIYEWGGADPHGMAEFSDRFRARSTVLDRSHRVPRSSFQVAQRIIHRVKRRVEKNYLPTAHLGAVIQYSSLELADLPRGTVENPTLILVRDRYKGHEVERKLMQEGIPFLTTGTSSLLNRPYGRAMKVWHKIATGQQITESERHGLYSASDPIAKNLVAGKEYAQLLRRGWIRSVPMPEFAADYFSMVDQSKPPRCIVSTIHGAKGKEAINVVLYLSSSQRVLDTFETTPDPEHRLMYVATTRAKNELHIIDGPNAYPL